MPVTHLQKAVLRLGSLVAAFVSFAAAASGQSAGEVSAPQGGLKTFDVQDAGYDAGFDFEALGVIGTSWRLGRTYFEESLIGARQLDVSIDDLLARPGPETLSAARAAWTVARTPYLRTEVFRFIVPQVANWEGRVNAWPLDEGLIDYVDNPRASAENPLADANLIASPELLVDGGKIDAATLTPAILDALGEAGGGEAADKNVTTGYHAIEFMLWGQDLNGTAPGAGNRPWTDFSDDAETCTNDNCDRRRAFLKLVSDRLVADLDEMVAKWQPGAEITSSILGSDPHEFIDRMVKGTAEFIQVELAGERMRLALTLNDPEEEHDCFSDQTHRSHYYNLDGVRSLFTGQYAESDGLPDDITRRHRAQFRGGTNVLDLYVASSEAKGAMDAARDSLQVLMDSADAGAPFDTLIAADNPEGNAKVRTAIGQLLVFSFALQSLDG